MSKNAEIQEIKTFRRILPQVSCLKEEEEKREGRETLTHQTLIAHMFCENAEIFLRPTLLFAILNKQILAATAKNFIIFNLGEFTAFSAIVIPSLLGLAPELNPDETVRANGVQTSWLGE